MTEQANDLRTIKETNERLRSLIEDQENGRKFWLGGVVRDVNYKSKVGNLYFKIDDAGYSINCMLHSRYKEKANLVKYGEVLDVYGAVKVYDKTAEFQLHVEDIRLAQRKLLDFDPSIWQELKDKDLWPRNKKDLPIPPRHIALITSEDSAGYKDFEKTYIDAKGQAKIQLFDVALETATAPSEIANAIQAVNQAKKADIIALVRGGGNLSAFNDIRVAEAICQSKIPVITGIGHQTNQTIADRVADEFTITPTDAAYKLAKLEPYGQKISVAAQSDFVPAPTIKEATPSKPAPKIKEGAPTSDFLQANGLAIGAILLVLIMMIVFVVISFQN